MDADQGEDSASSTVCPAATLPDVLRCLTSQGADFLIERLRRPSCLAAVRLSCRALRSFIDNNTVDLKLTIRPGSLQRWEAGRPPPPLALWPRCHAVTVIVAGGRVPGDEAARLALLPFVGHQPAALRRITSLDVCVPSTGGGNLNASNGERVVSVLAHRLPNLQQLDFQLIGTLSCEPLEQQLMYDALASLPDLASLRLRGFRCLERVGSLAACTGLTHLSIQGDVTDTEDDPLPPSAVAGLALLPRLECFDLTDCECPSGPASGLRALLRCLPPALEQLELQVLLADEGTPVGIELRGGKFSSVSLLHDEGVQLPSLAALAELLLLSPAMGPTLGRLSIDDLIVADRDQLPLQPGAQGPLHELLQRCACVQTFRVQIPCCAAAADARVVLGLLPLLGARCVQLEFVRREEVLALSFPPPDGSAARGTSGPAAGLGVGPRCRTAPPDPADLLRAALRRLAEGPSSQLQAGGSGDGGGAVGVSSSGTRLVLLQGPFLAARALRAINAGVRRLAAEAALTLMWGGCRRKPVVSYRAVPAAAAVLLECASPVAAAAVVAAAATLVAGGAVPIEGLEAALVHAAAKGPGPASVGAGAIKRHVYRALRPVMTAFWEGSAHGGSDYSQHERFECLVALWEQFQQLPKAVTL